MDLHQQQYLKNLVRKVCGNWWKTFSIKNFILNESIDDGEAYVKCELEISGRRDKKIVHIDAMGNGIVDALYREMRKEFAEKYKSLKDIRFKEFSINADLAKNQSSSAPVKATLKVMNARGKEFEFTGESSSLNAASINVVVKAIEFFVNAHNAVLKTYLSVNDADNRYRVNMVEKYKLQMSELVQITCYVDTIEEEKSKERIGNG